MRWRSSSGHGSGASAGRFMDPTALSIASFASGVERFRADYNTLEFYCNSTRGALCDPSQAPPSFGDPIFWTNDEGFDMNRDYFAQTQLEVQGKVKLYREWMPHIVADLHEMSGNSTYFFPPTAPPENSLFGDRQIQQMDLFGADIADAFDARNRRCQVFLGGDEPPLVELDS